MELEFPADELWICPKFDKLYLLNDPFLFKKGHNMMMVVNSCENAAEIDINSDIGTYTNQTCANSTMIEDNIEEVFVKYKTVT